MTWLKRILGITARSENLANINAELANISALQLRRALDEDQRHADLMRSLAEVRTLLGLTPEDFRQPDTHIVGGNRYGL